MHNFERYIKRQINPLINRPKSSTTIVNKLSMNSLKKNESLPKHENIYWKIFSRINHEMIDNQTNQRKKKIDKSKFYQNLLSAQQNINTKEKIIKSSQQTKKKRSTTQISTRTQRRQVFDCHRKPKTNETTHQNLIKRQSSGASDNYLKAKLQFSQRSPSTFSALKIIKI